MASDVERIARNEAVAREGNGRMHAWPERREQAPAERSVFLCECGNEGCRGRIWLTEAEYEAVRADEMRFAVLVGHDLPEAERVVKDHGRYVLVEKDEELRTAVEQTYGPRKR